MQTEVELPFADGAYRFRLGMAQILELERKCDIGIGGLHARILRGRFGTTKQSFGVPDQADYRISDLVETVRQGLIGGGGGTVDEVDIKMSPTLATKLIEAYVIGPDRQPLEKIWDLAVAITGALVHGYEPDAGSKKKPDEATATDGLTAP